MAALFLALIAFTGACAWESVESLIYIHWPEVEQHRLVGSIISTLDLIELCLLAGFLPLFGVLIVLALRGSTWQVPLPTGLARKRWIFRTSFILNSLFLMLIPAFASFGFWASSLTRRSGEDAKVYFLYDEGIPVPRWGYAMGLCRIALQSERNWGRSNVVLDHLTKETLRVALKAGKVLILATHGEDGYAATYYSPEMLGIWPAEKGTRDEVTSPHFLRIGIQKKDGKWTQLENVSVNSDLELAYIFACHAGRRAAQWQEHLAPAQVITYDRFSTVWDHAIWFAFTGPSEIKKIR